MPSIRQSIRSSTASKRPTSAIADGQIALNTASGTPGIFFKDNANNIIKAGPAHYGASAPNSSPAVGGSTGNSIGEAWLDSSLTPAGWKIWNGSAWVNATPLSSDTVQGLVELATNAEVQAGVDTARAVTAAGLQSKVSDSISTTSSSGIASSSAVKTAYDLANAALPKSGGIITGNLEIGSTGSFTFEGATADGFETTLAVVDPTADRTITFPDITGTVITTADTGTVTSTMIANGTIVDADINSSAAIAFSKLASLASANILIGNASGVPTSTTVSGDVTITNAGVTAITSNVIVNADINSAAAIAYSKLALASGIVNTDISASAAVAYSKLALSNSIVNADINSAAAIAGTKISPDFGSQNLTTTGNITATNHIAASGTATTPSIQVGNGTTYKPGVYSPGTDQVAISTNGVGRLFVDSSGRVGVGTSSPSSFNSAANQFVVGSGSGSQGVTIYTGNSAGNQGSIFFADGTTGGAEQAAGYLVYEQNANYMAFGTLNTERMRLDSSGRVGIGTISPTYKLHASGTTGIIKGDSAGCTFGNPSLSLTDSTHGVELLLTPINGLGAIGTYTNHPLAFYANNGERARIDSSGRLLVGTSSAFGSASNSSNYSFIQVKGNTSGTPSEGRITLGNLTASASIVAGDDLGSIWFADASGGDYARILAEADGTGGSNDYPGRLVFSTTADGASSPTERMRITNGGIVVVGNTSVFSILSSTATGSQLGNDGYLLAYTSSQTAAYFGRQTSDGTIVEFRQDGTQEGSVSVSGTTVSYNGAHLSRWSQLPGGTERTEILRGTVLSNIDEMCGWGEEANEQLNRMKVSDVEGDKDVSGVFQCWDDDDDTYTDDFYCAMTGDFIIRIAEGVTVERGDLLMSAGDGTAKPQDDDIIRSKTVAKVTSTHVTCTYEDGSYCVPCVLMAC